MGPRTEPSADSDSTDWERLREIARGWFRVLALAERLRREREGRPLLELVP